MSWKLWGNEMKKCPFCKAEIEENARFCLYCMTPLEEKKLSVNKEKEKKLLPIIIISVSLITVLFIVMFIFSNNEIYEDDSHASTHAEHTTTENFTTESSESSTKANNATNNTQPSTDSFSDSSPIYRDPENDKTEPTIDNNNKVNNITNLPTNTQSQPNNTTNNNETEQTIPVPTGNSIYNYRDAIPADDYRASPSITNNAVVITSVKTVVSNGIYEIPEEIDNKKVVAIMDNAFCDSSVSNTVKQVIIPASVKTINAYAFYKCYNLTDIYIRGEEVACPSVFIPEKEKRNYTLTIHCSSTCNDRNFRTYKTLCSYWDTVYKEWNG